jgi:undecaprenyl-diphosphatase
LEAIVLGVVQGLTEFLPVSSSGHLVLGGHLLGLKEPQLFFDILVHVATLLATCLFYRRALWSMVSEGFGGCRALASGTPLGETLRSHPYFRFGLMVVAGSVPTAVIGLVFKDALEQLFHEPRQAAGMLLVTAAILMVTRFRSGGDQGLGSMALVTALVIGVAQGMAIVPGISRSGTTIACALVLGVEREHAARFSFLLAIPAILGAMLLKLGEMTTLVGLDWVSLGGGFVAAAVTGFVALKLLIPVVNRGAFHYFAIYLIPAGVVGLLFLP